SDQRPSASDTGRRHPLPRIVVPASDKGFVENAVTEPQRWAASSPDPPDDRNHADGDRVPVLSERKTERLVPGVRGRHGHPRQTVSEVRLPGDFSRTRSPPPCARPSKPLTPAAECALLWPKSGGTVIFIDGPVRGDRRLRRVP